MKITNLEAFIITAFIEDALPEMSKTKITDEGLDILINFMAKATSQFLPVNAKDILPTVKKKFNHLI